MKDATGELSMTAVAVVAIAAIGVVFTTLIWPAIRTNILKSTYCSQTFDCEEAVDGMATCRYCPDNDFDPAAGAADCNGGLQTIQCPVKNSGA